MSSDEDQFQIVHEGPGYTIAVSDAKPFDSTPKLRDDRLQLVRDHPLKFFAIFAAACLVRFDNAHPSSLAW